jgi:hypothetical protein
MCDMFNTGPFFVRLERQSIHDMFDFLMIGTTCADDHDWKYRAVSIGLLGFIFHFGFVTKS